MAAAPGSGFAASSLRRARRVVGDDGFPAPRAQVALALRQRLVVRVDPPDVRRFRARRGQQAVAHPQLHLAHHPQVVVEQQIERLVDRSGLRVLDGQQAEGGAAVLDGPEDILEGRAGEGAHLRAEVLEDRLLRVRAGLSLERDGVEHLDAAACRCSRGASCGGGSSGVNSVPMSGRSWTASRR